MRPLVIVQSSPTKHTALALAAAAQARGIDVQDISFTRAEDQPPRLEGHAPVFVFGTVALLERWARRFPQISPWIWYDEARLGPEEWQRHLTTDFLNAEGRRLSLAQLQAEAATDNGPWHIRPLGPDKKPPGKLYSAADLASLTLPPETLLWTSPPCVIAREVRIWFIGRRIITASQYKWEGRLAPSASLPETEEACAFAQAASERFLPHPHCVMDVGQTADGSWKVIEFNTIHGAGWYAADPACVLDAFLAHYAEGP